MKQERLQQERLPIGRPGLTAWERAVESPRFWRRQLSGEPTRRQVWFDLAAGLALPIACVALDPAVFKGFALFGQYRVHAYLAIAVGLAVLATWLAAGRRLPAWMAGLAAGVLGAGAACAAALGVAMLPLSLVGLAVMFVGVLGFSPFLTAFVFARNAARALARAVEGMPRGPVAALVVAGAIVALAAPWAGERGVRQVASRAVDAILAGDPVEAERAVAVLRPLGFLVDLDALVWAYQRETDPARRSRLADAYRRISGDDIESRLAILLD